MARGRKPKTLATETEAPTRKRGRPARQPSVAPDPSNLTAKTFVEAFDDVSEKLTTKKSADAALANAYKRWEGMGVDKKELKLAIADAALDAATRQRKYEHHQRNMEWLGKPIGFQSAMDLQEPAPQSASAYDAGLAAGLAGASGDACPHDHSEPARADWISGWMEGQTQLATKIRSSRRGRRSPLNGEDVEPSAPAPPAAGGEADESPSPSP